MTALNHLILDDIVFVGLFWYMKSFTQSGPGLLSLILFSAIFSFYIKCFSVICILKEPIGKPHSAKLSVMSANLFFKFFSNDYREWLFFSC